MTNLIDDRTVSVDVPGRSTCSCGAPVAGGPTEVAVALPFKVRVLALLKQLDSYAERLPSDVEESLAAMIRECERP